MMRRSLIVLTTSVALLMMALVPAGATPPSSVEIVVPGFDGPFEATGPAVDDGVICESGDVETVFVKPAGFQSNRVLILTVGKYFVCDDQSGTFFAKLQVKIDGEGASFNWVIQEGTGDYEDLHGSGGGFVVPVDTDIYQGRVHID